MRKAKAKRNTCVRGAWVALAAATLGSSVGCDNEAALRTFREAAASTLQQGVSTMLNGLVEGTFAVIQMGDDASTRAEQTASPGG